MSVVCGKVVVTPNKVTPYKVVLEHEGGALSEHPVATVREGEEMIRRRTPQPLLPELDSLRDTPDGATP